MSSRDSIFVRVREALGPNVISTDLPDEERIRAVIPTTSDDPKSMRDEFVCQSGLLKTNVSLCSGFTEATESLRKLAEQNKWKKVALHRGSLIDQTLDALSCPILSVEEGVGKNDLEVCDAGITECELLVASSGTILVTSKSSGGRALSVLPPHHVVIAHVNQLVPDLSVAFARLKEKYRNDYPSFISFISGPSRTGDIERILVLGAHGPRQLSVILIQDEH